MGAAKRIQGFELKGKEATSRLNRSSLEEELHTEFLQHPRSRQH